MTLLLVGHRGCGKSGLLGRIAGYLPDRRCLDLDREIERRRGTTIEALFARRGEQAFRQVEREVLAEVLAEGGAEGVVALGAGFPGPLPPECRVLWVRRDSDRQGRIFLDRPRLDPGVDPLAEYGARFVARQERYRGWSGETLTLREGYEEPGGAEAAWFRDDLRDLGGALTVLPEVGGDLEGWTARRLRWGVGLFELRDDLLGAEQIDRLAALLPPDRVLYSHRRHGGPGRREGWRWDWDLGLGPCPEREPDILSLHTRRTGEGPAAAGERLVRVGERARLLKLAVPTDSFAELEAGHRWWRDEPERRVFLPISPDGSWAWYRLLLGSAVGLNFFREGEGSAPDQPLLLDWAERPARVERFAAILGDPVAHSRTPAEHGTWFGRLEMPVWRIRIDGGEWEGALDLLRRLGLRAAAVTAPHKAAAHRACARLDDEARRLGVVNTLAWNGEAWAGANTDRGGFAHALCEVYVGGNVAVWGGGGTLAVLQAELPEAAFHAARTGELRAGRPVTRPDLVVWATGRPGAEPPATWRPATVLDLSYAESSPGRAWALAVGARYVSGLGMFKEQARLQRRFWQEAVR